MIDSTALLDDASRLRERMRGDGYLFLPRLVAAERALAVKRDIMALLREHYIIEDDGATEPLWSGGPQPTEREYLALYERIVELESFQALARSPEIIAVVEAVAEGPVQVWEQQLVRIVYPDRMPRRRREWGPTRTAIPRWDTGPSTSTPRGSR